MSKEKFNTKKRVSVPGIIKNTHIEKPFVMIYEDLLNAELSHSAKGFAMDVLHLSTKWELIKSNLYTRFPLNKKTSIASSIKELEDKGFWIEYKFRVGSKNEHHYYISSVEFTEEMKAEKLFELIELYEQDYENNGVTSYINVPEDLIKHMKMDMYKRLQIEKLPIKNGELKIGFPFSDSENVPQFKKLITKDSIDLRFKEEEEYNIVAYADKLIIEKGITNPLTIEAIKEALPKCKAKKEDSRKSFVLKIVEEKIGKLGLLEKKQYTPKPKSPGKPRKGTSQPTRTENTPEWLEQEKIDRERLEAEKNTNTPQLDSEALRKQLEEDLKQFDDNDSDLGDI